MRYRGEERRDWLMLAAASLAGGVPARQAVENADQISAAVKGRFPEEDDDAGDEG
jgi:hypothetical protein